MKFIFFFFPLEILNSIYYFSEAELISFDYEIFKP